MPDIHLPTQKKITAILLGIMLAFLVLETGIWAYFKYHTIIEPTACRKLHPTLHHALVPNSQCTYRSKEWSVKFTVNSLGLRDREYTRQTPQGTARIIVVGDSFTEGFGVSEQDNFSSKLAVLLNTTADKPIEVLNAGVMGYSPTLEYLALKHKLLNLKPDIVILAFDLTDFHDEYVRNRQLAQTETVLTDNNIQWPYEDYPTDTQIEEFRNPIPRSLGIWWQRHIVFSKLAVSRIKYLLNIHQNPRSHVGNPEKDLFLIVRDVPESLYQELLNSPKQALLLIHQLLMEHNIPLLVVLYPHSYQADPMEWNEGRALHGFEANKSYSTKPQEDLATFLRQNNIQVLNTIPVFQNANRFPLYFPFDGHLNPNGHQLLASELANYLQSHYPWLFIDEQHQTN